MQVPASFGEETEQIILSLLKALIQKAKLIICWISGILQAEIYHISSGMNTGFASRAENLERIGKGWDRKRIGLRKRIEIGWSSFFLSLSLWDPIFHSSFFYPFSIHQIPNLLRSDPFSILLLSFLCFQAQIFGPRPKSIDPELSKNFRHFRSYFEKGW